VVSHDKNGNPSEKDLEKEKTTFESIVRYNVPVTACGNNSYRQLVLFRHSISSYCQ
jgi:hypothetical protein